MAVYLSGEKDNYYHALIATRIGSGGAQVCYEVTNDILLRLA